MFGFGLVMAVLIFVSTFFYKEKHFQQEEGQLPFLKSLKACFTNRSFIVFEVISFTVIYVQTALMLGLNYYLAEFEPACHTSLWGFGCWDPCGRDFIR
jgi:glycoside/pentoside/hexuronide:cation symporter, GPH family